MFIPFQKMNAKCLVSLLLLLAVFSGGCRGSISHMQELPEEKALKSPEPGKALVVFMRPSGLGWMAATSVLELNPQKDIFIGILPAKRKLTFSTEPGKKRYMVVSEVADFMEAELEAGKTYYVLVTPKMGMAWYAAFALKPIHGNQLKSEEFAEWFSECTYIENTPASYQWAEDNWPSIQRNKEAYILEWEQEEDKPTLRPDDGE